MPEAQGQHRRPAGDLELLHILLDVIDASARHQLIGRGAADDPKRLPARRFGLFTLVRGIAGGQLGGIDPG
jgi:hypothetical protein